MVDGIADHVQQRVFQVFEDAGIDFGFAAYDLKPCQFVVAMRDVAHRAYVLLKQRSHRDHANAHHLLLQVLVKDLGFAMHFQDVASGVTLQLFDHAAQTSLCDRNLTGERQHLVELRNVDAKRAVPGLVNETRNRRGGGCFVGEGSSPWLGAGNSFRDLFFQLDM